MSSDEAESRRAFDELLDTLRETSIRFAGEEWGITSPGDVAGALGQPVFEGPTFLVGNSVDQLGNRFLAVKDRGRRVEEIGEGPSDRLGLGVARVIDPGPVHVT